MMLLANRHDCTGLTIAGMVLWVWLLALYRHRYADCMLLC